MFGMYKHVILLLCLFPTPVFPKTPFQAVDDQIFLTVAFHSSLLPDNFCNVKGECFNSIKSLLKATSKALLIATDHHVYIKHVTLLLPLTWKSRFPNFKYYSSAETYIDADIQIENLKPGRQYLPYTIRSEGCGKPGKNIYISPVFISMAADYANLEVCARLLLRELGFLRFGLFEECGYIRNNTRFPSFYMKNNETIPTGCSNTELKGNKTGNCDIDEHTGLPGANCSFILYPKQSARPSILYQPSWKKAIKFCDQSTHQSHAPTKQNLLCNEKSAWEIIKTNYPSLKPLLPDMNTNTRFDTIFESPAEIILLLDQSRGAKSNGKFDTIHYALRHFFKHVVPQGTRMAFATIAENVVFKRHFIEIQNDTSRSSLINAIPINTKLDPKCKIDRGIISSYLFEPHLSRRIIVLVLAGKWELSNVDVLCSHLETRQMRLMIIFCPNADDELDILKMEALADIASCSFGSVFMIPEIKKDNHPVTLERIKSALRASIFSNELITENMMIHREYFERASNSFVKGEFVIDNSLGENAKSTFQVAYNQQKNVEKVILIGPDKSVYDDRSINEYFKDIFELSIGYNFIMKPGVWTYKLKLYKQMNHLSGAISVYSEKNSTDVITVNVWTNAHGKINATRTPVIIFAEVKQGHRVIVNADVVATVYSQDQRNNTWKIKLFDDGTGDPDITKVDGIYSRYFTHMMTPGFYTVELRVRGINLVTKSYEEILQKYITQETYSANCPDPAYRKKHVGQFERFVTGPSFYVHTARSKDQDIYPPNRITDLKMTNILHENSSVVLEWTAPGDDYDHDTVSEYEIRCSFVRDRLSDVQFDSATLCSQVNICPKKAKSRMSVTIPIQQKNVQLFIAIAALDKSRNKSPVSNIISVIIYSSDNKLSYRAINISKNSDSRFLYTLFLLPIILIGFFLYATFDLKKLRNYKNEQYDKSLGHTLIT